MVKASHTKPLLIEYPDSDGKPMTESDATRHYLIYCVAALRQYFKTQSQVYVSGNLFIYYQEGQPKKNVSPDVFVVFGVGNHNRPSYKVWEEGGKMPSFVLEITSLSTKKQDEMEKPRLYESLGVEEYFQYDPTGDYLDPPLKGQRLVRGHYEPIASEQLADGTISLPSQTLGLDLWLLPLESRSRLSSSKQTATPPSWGRELRLFNPKMGTWLRTYDESEESLEQTTQRAEQERQRADRLADRLRQMGIDPDTI